MVQCFGKNSNASLQTWPNDKNSRKCCYRGGGSKSCYIYGGSKCGKWPPNIRVYSVNLEIVQRCQMQGRDIQQIVWLEFHALSDDFSPLSLLVRNWYVAVLSTTNSTRVFFIMPDYAIIDWKFLNMLLIDISFLGFSSRVFMRGFHWYE